MKRIAPGRGMPRSFRILRTSWVMGSVGKNFALTMLRLHRERQQIGVAAACWRRLQRWTPLPSCLRCCTGVMQGRRVGTTWR